MSGFDCFLFECFNTLIYMDLDCFFVHREVLENAMPPSLERLILLQKQSGLRGMI